jgi:transcriptional regulator with XRE-family HTH domain
VREAASFQTFNIHEYLNFRRHLLDSIGQTATREHFTPTFFRFMSVSRPVGCISPVGHYPRIQGEGMVDTRQKLGKRIKELRKKGGMTQEALADLVKIDPRHLSRLERGVHYPSIDTLELIAQHLRVPLKEFFTFPEDETPEMLRERIVQSLIIMDESELRRIAKLTRPA